MRTFVKFLLWGGGILGAIVLGLYLAVFDFWTVPSDDPQLGVSVQPTLQAGDELLVMRHGFPSFGQLVRCGDPDAPGRFVVGRVVGQPRDVVELFAENLTVNNHREVSPGPCDPPKYPMVNPATGEELTLGCNREEFAGTTHSFLRANEHPERDARFIVDEARVFLLSDNHHLHLDSRDFGQINPAICQHITYRLWSSSGISDSARRFTFIW